MSQIKYYSAGARQIHDWKYHYTLKSGQKPEILSIKFRKSDLMVNHFKEAIETLFVRHDSLRTCFPRRGNKIYQAVMPFSDKLFKLSEYKISDLEIIKKIEQEYYSKLTNIEKPPLCYPILFISRDNYYFTLIIHHIISDYNSLKILKNELNLLYTLIRNGKVNNLPKLQLQLNDYLQKCNVKKSSSHDIKYWQDKLNDKSSRISSEPWFSLFKNNTLTKNKILQVLDSSHGMIYTDVTSCETLNIFDSLKTKYGFSYSSILYAIFFLLLRKNSCQLDYLIASPVSGRTTIPSRRIVGNLMGGIYFLINTEAMDDDEIKLIRFFQNEYFKSSRHLIYNHEILELNESNLRINCDIFINLIDDSINLNKDKIHKTHKPIGNIHYLLECSVVKSSKEIIVNWRYNEMIYSRKKIELMAKEFRNTVVRLKSLS